MESRTCTKCGEAKPVEEFYLNCYGRNGSCKPCVATKNRAYYNAKKESIAAKHAERRATGAEPDIGAVARRREEAFEDRYAARREKVNARKRERGQTEPQFQATVRTETQFRRALSRWGHQLEEFVSTDVDTFREWIAFQFAPAMNWDNYGTAWVYDHVEPKSDYDLGDASQVRECYRWGNLRPLTISANSQKYNTPVSIEERNRHETNYFIFNLIQNC